MIFFIIWRDVWQIYSHTGSNCNFLGLSFTCNIPPEKSRNDSLLLTFTSSWLFLIYCTNTHVIGIDITHYLLYQYTCNRYWHYTLFLLSKIMQMLLNMYLEFNHLTHNSSHVMQTVYYHSYSPNTWCYWTRPFQDTCQL